MLSSSPSPPPIKKAAIPTNGTYRHTPAFSGIKNVWNTLRSRRD
jgi:hypothetical protein